MFSIIGIGIVFGAILACFPMKHDNLMVLAQPPEPIIIGGAVLGTQGMAPMIGIEFARRASGKSIYDIRERPWQSIFHGDKSLFDGSGRLQRGRYSGPGHGRLDEPEHYRIGRQSLGRV